MAERGSKKQRMCVACGVHAGKADLFRIVRTAAGDVEFDPSGRQAGRGAYVCSAACFSEAVKQRKLERALKTKLDQNTKDKIEADLVSALRESQG